MFRIGEFSRIARVSCRLLRYYDEIGLLQPATTDRHTGYRYYRADQLSQLNRILVLRELGLSLAEIARLVAKDVPPAELRGMLEMRRARVAQSLREQAERLQRIEGRLAQLESDGEAGPDDVILRREPARRLLSLRQVLASFADGVALVGRLAAQVPRRVGPGVVGPLVVIAHSPEFEPHELDVEMGFFLESDWDAPVTLDDGRALTVRDEPAIERLATCARVGPPQDAHQTTARIGHFAQTNGYRLSGPSREVFLRRPHPERMQDAVVEMQFPVESAPGGLVQRSSSSNTRSTDRT